MLGRNLYGVAPFRPEALTLDPHEVGNMILPNPIPITGREGPADSTVPEGALSDFYRAFNSRDLDLMSRIWLTTDEASMDNPLGGIKRGWEEVKGVYERIFSSPATVKVEFFEYRIHADESSFLAVGRERGTLTSDGVRIDLRIRTSRWFRRVDGRWRQLHHHGSIDEPELLAHYQAAVA